MKFFSSLSIRKKLLFLIFVAVLPALGIILFSGIERREKEIVSTKRDILYLVQSLAAQQEQLAASTRQMLKMLAQRPEVQKIDAVDCNRIFKDPHITREGHTLIAEAYCNALYNNKGAWVFAKASPLHDQAGNIIGAIESARDITDRKRAGEAIRESEKRFDQLAEQSRTIVWEVDTQGLYLFVSQVSEIVLGYRPDQLVRKKHFYDLHPEEGRETFKNAALDVFGRKKAFENLINCIQAKDGSLVWVATNGLPLLNADGTLRGYRGSDSDITERKQAEEALKEEHRRLQQALDEVRTLRGIVPICAYCKKIRDDEGYWNQVEQYVSKHTDAQFSHGICPTCLEREMKAIETSA